LMAWPGVASTRTVAGCPEVACAEASSLRPIQQILIAASTPINFRAEAKVFVLALAILGIVIVSPFITWLRPAPNLDNGTASRNLNFHWMRGRGARHGRLQISLPA
jgi:hypothetical protein